MNDYKTLKQKYDSLINERDAILQAVYNHFQYNQPVKYSLKTKLIRHCKERGLEIPKELLLD